VTESGSYFPRGELIRLKAAVYLTQEGRATTVFIVHVDLSAREGFSDALSATFRDVFYPTIVKQHGFVEARLLVATAAGCRTHRLVIEFEREELQREWISSGAHQTVWERLEPSIALCSVDTFSA
jgi:hypothetical protein